ncbi:uncharacterized protein LOC123885972 [Trifolium pratense]|uniref:uncharacterized protein LOC123885972 n=1 Tax=Trifolium pratense TaxID=57577 RepID=UPI001E6918B2|nr:uncharacterized protein LOC123885972 [Trifolium pratense]
MSESSQTTKSARSTRSKAKIEYALIIKDVVPVTTVHASKPKVQSRVAEKKGKGKSVEKKKTSKVSDAISPSATEVNPKTVSDVVETIVPTGDNPSLEKLGSDAEKRDLNAMSVETEMEDTPTEQEEVETAEKEPVMEAAAEKDVETTDTTSESIDEETRTADEGTSDNEGDTQSEESNQSIPTEEPEIEADKSAGVEEEKEKDAFETLKNVLISTPINIAPD